MSGEIGARPGKTRDVIVLLENVLTAAKLENVQAVIYNERSTIFQSVNGAELRLNNDKIISVRFSEYKDV